MEVAWDKNKMLGGHEDFWKVKMLWEHTQLLGDQKYSKGKDDSQWARMFEGTLIVGKQKSYGGCDITIREHKCLEDAMVIKE